MSFGLFHQLVALYFVYSYKRAEQHSDMLQYC